MASLKSDPQRLRCGRLSPQLGLGLTSFKAHTHTPIFGGSAVKSAIESADSIGESADCTTNAVIVGQLSVSNMFNVLKPLEVANRHRPTANWPSGYWPLLPHSVPQLQFSLSHMW